MLARLTSKNQLTLPRAVTAAVDAGEYLDVTANRADGARAKLVELALSEADIADAVAWARSGE